MTSEETEVDAGWTTSGAVVAEKRFRSETM